MLNWKTRRRLWGKWQRLVRWEFWPIWAVYPPIALWGVVLAVRYREWTLWANCNPAMPASGMALESKGGILDGFKGTDGAVRLARYLKLRIGEEDALKRIAEAGFEYPLVLKPDLGQRGQGVEVVGDDNEARQWLKHCEDEVVVQEFIGGLEFGVHWSKSPDTEKGQIRSLCGKHPQKVTGDGKSTLEELVLSDSRAVMMAGYYEKKYAAEWLDVLADGEEFVVAPIGTHSRGAIFTDERHLVTDALVEVFDELGARFPGFCFGRYDVKVPSVEDLQAGRNIAVLELNAVMGEPAHVYQPGYSWWQGMRDFFAHFQRASEIGQAWQKRGVAPPTLDELWALAVEHREKSYYEIDGLEAREES